MSKKRVVKPWEKWAIEELKRAGYYDKDGTYKGTLGDNLEELIKVFSKQEHSGFSASVVSSAFHRLVYWKPLSPITDDPEEWMEIGNYLYQSRRCPSVFTTDELLKQGKAKDHDYYYKVDRNGRFYRDIKCSKIVRLPYYPPTTSKLKRGIKGWVLKLLQSFVNKRRSLKDGKENS